MGAALDDFRASLAITRELLRIEEEFDDPPRSTDSLAVQGLRGGATVLTVAAFEDFMEAMFLEQLGALDGSPPPIPLDSLPFALQFENMHSSLNRALRGPRYLQTQKVERLPAIRIAATRLVEERIDPSAMSEVHGNPNSDAVKRLFRSVGQSAVFDTMRPRYEERVGPIAETFLQDYLDHIVGNRHVVAHTGSALNISRKDLRDWVEFIDLLAELMDEELATVIDGILHPAP
jgi:hypothetical protein